MRKIAIVDDVEDNRDLLYFVLGRQYDVLRYACGTEVLTQLHTDRPDLIILDISLPDMSGFEVLRRIRQEARFSSIPVIAVTAHAMLGDREKILSAGFNDYLSKPILDIDAFVHRVAGHLAQTDA